LRGGAPNKVNNTGGNYTYDEFGRLKSFASNAGDATTFNWTYDHDLAVSKVTTVDPSSTF
jgi:YD repeat-containing protein